MSGEEVIDKLWKIFVGLFSLIVGSGFLLLALSILLNRKIEISNELFFALRLLLALGAGFVSAGILGTISIEIKPGKRTEFTDEKMNTKTIEENYAIYFLAKGYQMTLTAGGPIAITVLVWVYSPEALQTFESIFIY